MEDYDEDYDDEDNSMDFSEDRIPITGGLVSAGEDHPHRTVGHQIDFRDERNSKGRFFILTNIIDHF